eukprot:gi/632945265/ref/XP_007887955.1/ PREDICTED: uncharacterized protein LOC103176306 [Callorhinchus milii]
MPLDSLARQSKVIKIQTILPNLKRTNFVRLRSLVRVCLAVLNVAKGVEELWSSFKEVIMKVMEQCVTMGSKSITLKGWLDGATKQLIKRKKAFKANEGTRHRIMSDSIPEDMPGLELVCARNKGKMILLLMIMTTMGYSPSDMFSAWRVEMIHLTGLRYRSPSALPTDTGRVGKPVNSHLYRRYRRNETKPVQMMCQKEEFESTYIREVETRILELPYVQKELSMIIMLPDLKGAASGLQKLQNGLTFDKLLEWTNPDKMYNDEIEVMLPKVKIENTYDFTSTLGGLGMVDAFDDSKHETVQGLEEEPFVELKWRRAMEPSEAGNSISLLPDELEKELDHKVADKAPHQELCSMSRLKHLRCELQNGLTFDKLLDCNDPDKMDNDEVVVMLPQFKMENTYDFTSTLGVMGMVDAFDALKANFSGMTEKNDLILLKVVHKTFVEVHEEDTEGAAVTAAILMLRCAMITVEFVADYPFLLFIRHNKTHNILFFGSFSSP